MGCEHRLRMQSRGRNRGNNQYWYTHKPLQFIVSLLIKINWENHLVFFVLMKKIWSKKIRHFEYNEECNMLSWREEYSSNASKTLEVCLWAENWEKDTSAKQGWWYRRQILGRWGCLTPKSKVMLLRKNLKSLYVSFNLHHLLTDPMKEFWINRVRGQEGKGTLRYWSANT